MGKAGLANAGRWARQDAGRGWPMGKAGLAKAGRWARQDGGRHMSFHNVFIVQFIAQRFSLCNISLNATFFIAISQGKSVV